MSLYSTPKIKYWDYSAMWNVAKMSALRSVSGQLYMLMSIEIKEYCASYI